MKLRRLSFLLGVLLSGGTLFLWQSLVAQERAEIRSTTQQAAAHLNIEINEQIEPQILTLVRMAKRWEILGKPTQTTWEEEAALSLEHTSGYQAIAWIDPSLHVRWFVPQVGNEMIAGLDLTFEPHRREALEAARNNRKPILTRSLDLLTGSKGFQVYIPIYSQQGFEGYIAGLFDLHTLFDPILGQNGGLNYSISVWDGDQSVYRWQNPDTTESSPWTEHTRLPLDGLNWQMQITPTAERLNQLRSPIPTTALIAGLSISWLLALVVELMQRTEQAMQISQQLKQSLQGETTERHRTESLLKVQKHVLEMIASAVPLPDILTTLVEKLETAIPESLCSILLLDEAGLHLRRGAAPNLPETYNQAIDGVAIGPGVGSCGTAAFLKQPVMVADITTDPLWENYRDLALLWGLRACWSVPIFARDGRVLGTIALYFRQPQMPEVGDRYLMESTTNLAGIAIEYKQSEEKLQTTQSRLQHLITFSPTVIYSCHVNGEYGTTYISENVFAMFGYTAQAFLQDAQFWLQRVHPEDRPTVDAILKQVLERGHAAYTYRFRHADGTYRWTSDELKLVRNALGEPTEIVGSWQDITDRKHAEDDLQESKEHIRLMVESVKDYAIFMLNPSGHITTWNAGAAAIQGYAAEEILGQHCAIFYPDVDVVQGAPQRTLQRAAEVGCCEDEGWRVRKDGSYYWANVVTTALRGQNGELRGFSKVARDVTERKQAEASLKQSLKELADFKFALDESAIVAITDVKGVIQYANDRFCELSQYSREELIGQDHRIVNSGYHPKSFFINLWATISQGEIWRGEVCNRAKDGSLYWVDTTIVPLMNGTGKPYQYIAIRTEITDRKLAEAALRQQAERERLVAEIAQRIRQSLELDEILNTTVTEVRRFLQCDRVLIFRFELDWSGVVVVESVDAQCRSILGEKISDSFFQNVATRQTYEQGQIQVVDNVDTVHLTPCHLELLQKFQVQACLAVPILQEQQLWGLLVVHQCTSSRTWQTQEVSLLRHLATQTAIAIQQAQLYQQAQLELAERKWAEQKIREQAALLDISTDAILVCDLNHHVQFWNKGAERLYGWSVDQVWNRNVNDLLYKYIPSAVTEADETTLRCGEWQGELAQINQAGDEVVVESRWTLVRDSAEQPKSILMVNTDITQKKQLERQFLRSQRMESIGTLAGGIAHDLNNVLAPIMMSVQLLRLRATDSQSQQWIDIVENSARRGSDLIKQVLSFARGLDGEYGVLQIRHLMTEVKQIAEETFPKSIRIHTEICRNLRTVFGDATHLHQVLMNLCVNARDAMPDGGTLSIKAENCVLTEQDAQRYMSADAGTYVMISIADTGIGIPSKNLDRIFEPFFTTKEMGKGTGLGLSTVMGIIKSHKGFVAVSSQPGQGTEFQVFLPAREETEITLNDELQLPIGNGEWILVVDDEAPIRKITSSSLVAHNYQVMTASNGVEAIACYTQHQTQISLVLIDIMMPLMDGITTIRKLKEMNPQLKIIASSGMVAGSQLPEIASCGLQSFLEKPYSTEDLLTTVQNVLETA